MKRKVMISLIFILLISIGIIYKINSSSNSSKVYLNEDNVTNIKQQVGIYVESENGTYKKTNSIPSQDDGYVLDTESSMCEGNTTIGWDNDTWSAVLNNIEKEDLKCYLYFRKKNLIENATDKSLGEATFTGTSCDSNCDLQQNGIYEAEDDFGTSYYYRGTVDNNWVVFGNDNSNNYIWWRIIRINGNGTIRLIYAGTSSSPKSAPSAIGNTTMIKPQTQINNNERYEMAVKFNEQYNDNTYVGYMIGGTSKTSFGETHTNTNNSMVLNEIVNWYNNNTNLGSLAEKYIDVDTGFCGDRGVDTTSVSGYTGQGYGTQLTAYSPWTRLYNGSWRNPQTPTLKCGKDKTAQKRDLYNGPKATADGTKGLSGNVEGNNELPVPVGLITIDEVVFAGGFGGKTNSGYWLYTNRYYWTMSPYYFSGGYASMFDVTDSGKFDWYGVDGVDCGVRPVINLKSNVKITGNGTTTDPYIVK